MTNEEYLKEINEMLTEFANNRHGSYKTCIPEDKISETFSLTYCIVKEMCFKYREMYADKQELLPENERVCIE